MENILAAMRNNFCQNNSIGENKSKDVLAQMKSNFCDKSKSKAVRKVKKQNGKVNKPAEELELMVKVKEEPVSDDENDKNENEETIAIDHTNCLEEPTKGKAKESENLPLLSENLIKNEVISLNIEEEKESNCYMQQIKQENNNDEKEVHTKSDI
ncbi:unnamed protein product, partial [Meganyctiphanes norvegica]